MTDKTVSHAIERGIDFLFVNRLFCGNEPRLWEDFDLLLGPSDEWVTAYATRALLHTNEERSVWAAREALHALLIEQSSTGKALTDGMFTVLFSTTPLSASRNYSVNIPSVNPFNDFQIDFSVSAFAGNLLEQSLIPHGPVAEQRYGLGELVAGWSEAVVNMRRDNWMNQSVKQSALLQLP